MEKAVKPVFMKSKTDEIIFQHLRQEANRLVESLRSKRNPAILLKAFLFPTLYFLAYISVLNAGDSLLRLYIGYISMGLLLVMIFLNIIHDAVHGTIFRKKSWNKAYVHLFDLMGANSYIWQFRHVRLHHNYPNVDGWDSDVEQSPIARIFPSGKFSALHKYQYIYLPFMYPLYLANWLLIRDFKDFFTKKTIAGREAVIPFKEYIKLFAFKLFFIGYTVIVPILVLPVASIHIVAAFFVMLLSAGIVSLMVLLSPHANTESAFPVPDEDNKLSHSWMMHMLCTTNDVSNDNWFTRFFMGCFNYHVVHHLFPHINHVYYPEITARLEAFAKEHALPYRKFSLGTSLKNHYQLLKQNRMPEDVFDDTM